MILSSLILLTVIMIVNYDLRKIAADHKAIYRKWEAAIKEMQEMREIELSHLERCSECSSDAEYVMSDNNGWRVVCKRCHWGSGVYSCKENAANWWNATNLKRIGKIHERLYRDQRGS